MFSCPLLHIQLAEVLRFTDSCAARYVRRITHIPPFPSVFGVYYAHAQELGWPL